MTISSARYLLAALLSAGAVVGTAHADTTVVTSYAPSGWAFDNRDPGGILNANPTGVGGFVNGPASPPFGLGSAQLATGNGTTGGDAGQELRNSNYAGVPLGGLTALSYWTYASSWNGQQLPYLQLYISTTGGTTADDRLTFEPAYTPSQGAVTTGSWQEWDALAGNWYDDTGFGNPGVAGVKSLSDFKLHFPDATIVNPDGFSDGIDTDITLGGIRITTGFASPGNVFDTNVDGVTIGTAAATTTYDFEVPEPASMAVLGFGLAGLAAARRRRRG